ncbi:hypothetical protein NDU88_006463, partial [Pleurodeles waltl]
DTASSHLGCRHTASSPAPRPPGVASIPAGLHVSSTPPPLFLVIIIKMSCNCPAVRMVLTGCVFLVLFCFRADSVPLSAQLSEEEEKVSKCIMEVLADTLSNPIPAQISSNCRRILKEDERIVSMLKHQHLMRELEDLNHRENSKHRFGQEAGHGGWEEQGEDSEEDELKKRNQEAGAAHHRDPEKRGTDSSEKDVKTRDSKSKRDHEDVREFEKTE